MTSRRSLASWVAVLAVLAAIPLALACLKLRQPSREPAPPHRGVGEPPQASVEHLPPEPQWCPPPIRSLEAESDAGDAGAVLVGAHTVIRFKSPQGAFSAGDRARLAAARLERMMAGGKPAGMNVTQTADGSWGLFAEGTLIATADPETARLNNTTPQGLAETWLRNLERALRLKPDADEQSGGDLLTRCERVVDGDTIVIEGGERVRYIGVDTPETKHPRKPVEHFGHEASEFNRQLVEGKRMRIEFDVQRRDKYRRLLGYVYVQPEDETEAHEVFVNAELVGQGYAKVYTVPPNVKHAERFLELERAAREHQRGLWGVDDNRESNDSNGNGERPVGS